MSLSMRRLALNACRASKALHTSAPRSAVTAFTMPAMSPTMTEGGIANWKKKEGEAFATGDILLEIETDKATMDVEAQDDGIMGKIITPDGSKGVPVGRIIALLAEEGDDISNLEVPSEDAAASSSSKPASPSPSPSPPSGPKSSEPPQAPTQPEQSEHAHAHPHSKKPLFPSVVRLLQDHNLSADVDSLGIKGTGIRGMITKGDILAHLGLAQGPNGTLKDAPSSANPSQGKTVEKDVGKQEAPAKKEFTGDEARRAILAGMEKRIKPVVPSTLGASFDSIIADYAPRSPALPLAAIPMPVSSSLPTKTPPKDYFDGLI